MRRSSIFRVSLHEFYIETVCNFIIACYHNSRKKKRIDLMIFCVEDDSCIRELMQYALCTAGYETCGFSCAEEVYRALREVTPELILLDIMLPGEDGISILKKLRANSTTAAIPIIMATAKGSEYDKVLGLDSGADDYLAKPFGMMELISRVKAVLCRTRTKASETELRRGGITMDTSAHTVKADGKPVFLTRKEYELLRVFLRYPGYVFSREQLLNSVWGADFAGETRTVDVHIGTLRTKLGACGEIIRTVRGVGYKLEEILLKRVFFARSVLRQPLFSLRPL